MRTSATPGCLLCGSLGRALHRELADTLFDAAGTWTVAQCTNPRCRLLWLDPMPVAEDLAEAYAGYYTHTSPTVDANPGPLRTLSSWAKSGYHHIAYGYDPLPGAGLPRLGHLLLSLLPIRRGFADAEVRYLECLRGGRLLDVGCGSGAWLSFMQTRGWDGHGVDFDHRAVAVARAKGLPVSLGSLEDQQLPAASFDAVTLNHVVEHLPSPVSTLRECRRVLRPGGKLVVSTPNGTSLGHRLLGPSWRGLEPPRHLHVFNFMALEAALRLAGFQRVVLHGHVSPYVINESLAIRLASRKATRSRGLPLPWRTLGAAIAAYEALLADLDPAATDCVTAVATA